MRRTPIPKMLLLVLAGFAFVAAAHLGIFYFTGSPAGDVATHVIWGGGMVIGLVLPVRIYMQWKRDQLG